jgi:serine/threonine protein kinase
MNHTCRYPVIKLGDFGCAAPHSEVKSGALAQFSCDAECKARFKGAAHLPETDDRYTPPEGANVDPSGDVYQIGLVMLCLLFKKKHPQDALAAASGSPPEWASIYTPKLVGLIATCIQADIANRATSDSLGDEITAHLTQALESGELTVQDKIMIKSR